MCCFWKPLSSEARPQDIILPMDAERYGTNKSVPGKSVQFLVRWPMIWDRSALLPGLECMGPIPGRQCSDRRISRGQKSLVAMRFAANLYASLPLGICPIDAVCVCGSIQPGWCGYLPGSIRYDSSCRCGQPCAVGKKARVDILLGGVMFWASSGGSQGLSVTAHSERYM